MLVRIFSGYDCHWQTTVAAKNHDRATKSRQLPEVIAHAQNHSIHGGRDSAIFLQACK